MYKKVLLSVVLLSSVSINADDRFRIVDKSYNDTQITIVCNQGPYANSEHKICSNSSGDWSNGCTLGSYRYKTFYAAVKSWCEF
jgi:hypothetical protein